MGEHRRKADANNLAGDDEILHLRSRFTTDRARLVERAAHHNPRRFVSRRRRSSGPLDRRSPRPAGHPRPVDRES